MSMEPAPAPGLSGEPGRARAALIGALRIAGALLLMAAVSGATAYGVFEWRIRVEQQGVTAQVQALRDDLQRQSADLADRLRQQERDLQQQVQQVQAQAARVEQAAEGARLLMTQNGGVTTLDARLREIDTLRLELQKSRAEFEAKLQGVEKSVVEQAARQGRETAQALAVELAWKSLLIKAQGEVLLAQVNWAEGNRGLARDELAIAAATLRKALDKAPDSVKPAIKQVTDLSDQTRSALILEQSAARDSLNLLWHRVSELLGSAGGS